MKVLKTILLLLFFNTCVFAQNTTDSTYLKKVDLLYQKAFKFYGTNHDSLDFHLNEVKNIARGQNDLKNYINSVCFSNRSAAHFYHLDIIQSNLTLLDSILTHHDTQLNTLETAYKLKNDIDFDKGIYYYRVNDFKKSKKSFNSIINSIENLPDSLKSAESTNFLMASNSYIAKINFIDGKHDLAKEYYHKNLNYLKNNDPTNKNSNRIYSLLAEVLKSEKKYALSNQYFSRSLRHNLKNNGDASSIVTEANHLLENHLSTFQLDSANYYLKIIKDNLPSEHPRWNVYHEAKAKILQAENNYPEAEASLQNALELIKQKWKGLPHNDVAESYNQIGLLHSNFNQPEKAFENYNLALQQFSQNNISSTINQTAVLKILKNKAQTLSILDNTPETIQTVNLAIQTLDTLKPSFKNNNDKLFLMEEAFPIFESGIEASYNLFQKTKQDSLIDKAFFYAEKSKSALLLEALLSTKASAFANIPKEILQKEQLLKSQINHVEKQINSSENDKLQDELFQLKKDYRELINSIETNYKSYYNLKYNSQVVSVNELQNLLKPEDIVLSYFYGNNAIYTIAITKKSKSIQQYKIDSNFEKEIISMYEMLNDSKSNLQDLNKKSHALYMKLIAPSLVNLQQKNVIVIADGLLNYIPFASLNTNKENTSYFIENHAISYANSATLLKQLTQKEEVNNKVLAFAPGFKNTSSSLLPLPNNETEARDILNYFNGRILTNEEATLSNFNSKSNKYGMLHFATHAILNDETPEYSYLAFQPNETNNNLLYVSDLYNLNLNTNLVTLSACESGIGNLKRGEGFLSLARGFYFSGASSISSTLWKINDASSLKIMDAFYKNLSEEKTKNIALQKAQLDFLETNKQNALVHPYYWSGFVISGNTNALASSSNMLWYLLGAVVILFIGIAFKKRRKN